MKHYRYKLTVKHGDGEFTITTVASTEKIAKKAIMNFEKCPESAITNVELLYEMK